jgi:aryl-alcohol dehydrogenase-like predicted oxidoreductase
VATRNSSEVERRRLRVRNRRPRTRPPTQASYLDGLACYPQSDIQAAAGSPSVHANSAEFWTARTLVQLKENLACLQITFTDEQVAQLDAVSRIDPGFPHTMLTSAAIPSMFGHVKVATAART